MHRPQKLLAAFFSAALLCTGVAFADKGGGGHGDHGKGQSGAPGQSSAPGQNNGNGNGNGHGGGPGIQGPMKTPSQSSSNQSHGAGSVQGSSAQGSSAQSGGSDEFQGNVSGVAGAQVTVRSGKSEHTFAATAPVIAALERLKGKSSLLFFTTGGTEITAVAAPGEAMKMHVTGRNGNTFMLQSDDGQSRLIALDAKTAARLHVGVGSNLSITAKDAKSGKIVALDMIKAHGFDKFASHQNSKKSEVAKAGVSNGKSRKVKSKDRKVADVDVTSSNGKCGHGGGRNGNPAFANQMAKDAANDASGHNPPGLPHECVNPAGNTRGFCKSSSGASICGGSGSSGTESQVAAETSNGKCGHSSGRNGNPAFANQMAKDAANDASGHNPPGLPHECVNPAGHTRGFCKSSSSESICGGGISSGGESQVAASTEKPCGPSSKSGRHGNPAFANQMAKDQANDISGHNPPGLPHECVNPAGHTRGFCKSRSSESAALCAGGIAPSGSTVAATTPGGSSGVGGGSNGAVAPGRTVSHFSPGLFSGSSLRGPGAPVGFIPGSGGSFGSAGTRGASAAAPTHVLGAAVGPAGARSRKVAMTRVLPVAIQPVGKRRCVWYKTGVLGASTGPYRVVGRTASGGKPVLHKKCVTNTP